MRPDATPRSPPVLARLVGPLLFLTLGAGVEWLLFKYRQEQAAELKVDNALQGEAIRARITGELKAATAAGDSLADYWVVRRNLSGLPEIRDLLAELYRRGRHVRGFAISADYRVAQVFPHGDGGPAIGLDYRDQPGQWPFLRRSIDSRSPVLEGPAPASLELAYWVPVFVDGEFQGLVNTLIDGPSLFSAARLALEGYYYALRVQSRPSADPATVLGEDGLFEDPGAAVTDIEVPGGRWRLAVKSAAHPAAWSGIARALGWLLAGLLAVQSAVLVGLKRQLPELALYDRLTGLPSRHLFLDRLKQTIRRAKRNGGSFSVLFVNLDEFKSVNHSQGEKVGDMMLAGIGKRLINSIRHCDTVTRWGGDEFLILLDACPLEQAGPITESLRHKIELPVAYGGRELRVGAAMGTAAYPQDGHSLAALLKAAQAAMLKDKSRRKMRGHSLYPPSAGETAMPGGQANAEPPA